VPSCSPTQLTRGVHRLFLTAIAPERHMRSPFDAQLRVPAPNRPSLEAYVRSQSDWFHTFDFGSGLVTPGRDPSAKKLHHLCLPADMRALSVLDIGAYEGFFSFHCEQRGAERIVAADRVAWEWPGSTAKPNFDAVRRALDSRVQVESSAVEELSRTFMRQTFDIVLFLGVLYHAPDMVDYLHNVFSVTSDGGVCIIETYLDALDSPHAQAVIYSPEELNNDASNWWGPNLKATATMLRRVGFRQVDFINLWDVNTGETLAGRSWEGPVRSARGVFHAHK
jgi:tRNA (mo5U34)-methyltransferase